MPKDSDSFSKVGKVAWASPRSIMLRCFGFVLAGDISVRGRGVTWANEVFECPVIYVWGNHEFYKGHIDRTLIKMRDAAEEHVHVLDNQILIIGNTRFLVATAWTDYTAMGDYKAAMRGCAEWMSATGLQMVREAARRLSTSNVSRALDLVIHQTSATRAIADEGR